MHELPGRIRVVECKSGQGQFVQTSQMRMADSTSPQASISVSRIINSTLQTAKFLNIQCTDFAWGRSPCRMALAGCVLPRALANPGQWCWFNAVLQGLASVNDPRWWNILRSVSPETSQSSCGGEVPKDLLACLASVLLYINRAISLDADYANQIICNLAAAIDQECGLSSTCGEQQDAHEALVQLLEAMQAGLLKRQLRAVQDLQRPTWDPLRPWLVRTAAWAKAAAACRWFQELWQGTMEDAHL